MGKGLKTMYNIFISHVTEEQNVALSIKEFLENAYGEQLHIFVSGNILMGSDWFENVKIELENCDMVITLMSKYSNKRPWINIESGYAVMSHKKMIPICYNGFNISDLDFPYSSNNGFNILDNNGVKRFLETVAKLTKTNTKLFENSLDNLAETWIKNQKKAIASVPVIKRCYDSPLVWLMGSYRNIREKEELSLFVRTLSKIFSRNDIRTVMGTSDLLDDFAMEMFRDVHKTKETTPQHTPVVIFGVVSNDKGIKTTFYECIRQVPDMAILIGGYYDEADKILGNSFNEYHKAVDAEIPTLSLAFTGGVASQCESTFNHLLDVEIKSLDKMYHSNSNFKEEVASKILEIIQAQYNLMYHNE